ncbi:hypothetical protein RKLH11_679 [Rhodobacteraceae bacterium KLH11]|nr:hypothetical protein RKLH11_679 [Rhodobacteraceae bacterium KLH11]
MPSNELGPEPGVWENDGLATEAEAPTPDTATQTPEPEPQPESTEASDG